MVRAAPADRVGPQAQGILVVRTARVDRVGRVGPTRSYQQHQQEQEEVQKIFAQMMADRQKWMMEMWKIMQDTQTKIYEIMTSSLMYRQQVSDKMNALWSETMREA